MYHWTDYIMVSVLILICLVYAITVIIFIVKMCKLHKEAMRELDEAISYYNTIQERYLQ